MKLYSTIQNLKQDQFNKVLTYCFSYCDTVNIYFPNECSEEILTFKNKFLQAISLLEIEDERSILEPKEGFMMLIATLNEEVKKLLCTLDPDYRLSFGLIQNENVLLYVGDEGEVVIETEDTSLKENTLFKDFKSI